MVEAEWDSEYFSLDARRNRELFARYGYAMHNAQCLEKQLAIMLALADPGFFTECPQVRGSLFDAALSETFGAIWKKLSAVVPFGKDVVDRIYEAKTARNHLAHNYFWQHAADLLDARKQELSIARREHHLFRCLRSSAHAVRESSVSRSRIATSSLRAACGR